MGMNKFDSKRLNYLTKYNFPTYWLPCVLLRFLFSLKVYWRGKVASSIQAVNVVEISSLFPIFHFI